ncbi:MAG: hypothetical protein ACC657_14180 [Thiohalomonadales bacterium]
MNVRQLILKLGFDINTLSLSFLFKYGMLAFIVFIFALSTSYADSPQTNPITTQIENIKYFFVS